MKSTKLLGLLFFICLAGMVACKDKDKDDDKDKSGETKMDGAVQKNIETSKSFYTLFEKEDWAAIEKIVSADFKDHSPMADPNAPFNRDTLMHYLKSTKEGFPDMKFEVSHVAGVDDMVFVHYRFTGTNSGPFMGMAATNKKIDYMGVDLLKIKDGMATEHWDYGDNITFMKQMGMMREGQDEMGKRNPEMGKNILLVEKYFFFFSF